MALSSKHKVDTSFSLSSMTDIVFLLLIFFMLTSNFITPSGLPVNLPTSKGANIVLQKVSVSITKDLKYYINDRQVSFRQIEEVLAGELSGSGEKERLVVLHIDKTVPVEQLVNVASIATKLKAKVSIATKPE